MISLYVQAPWFRSILSEDITLSEETADNHFTGRLSDIGKNKVHFKLKDSFIRHFGTLVKLFFRNLNH